MPRYDFLYYPYINFRNEEWLKMVALYGDSVSRIVPVGYPTKKLDTVAALAEKGFIRDIAPNEAGHEPAVAFGQFLLEYQDLLRPVYAVDKTKPWASDPDDRHLEDEAVTKRAYVERSKLSGTEIQELEQTGLIVVGREGKVNWVGMHPRLANLYMTLLANKIVEKKKGLRLNADFTSHHVNVHASSPEDMQKVLLPELFTQAELSPSAQPQVRATFATFVFEKIIPAGLADVPIARILKLRADHFEDLVKYQEAIDSFVQGNFIQEIDDVDQLKQHIEKEYEGKIRPALERLKNGLYLSKVKFWSGLAAVSFMPVVAFGGPVVPIVMGTVAGACGLMALSATARTDLNSTLEGNQVLLALSRGEWAHAHDTGDANPRRRTCIHLSPLTNVQTSPPRLPHARHESPRHVQRVVAVARQTIEEHSIFEPRTDDEQESDGGCWNERQPGSEQQCHADVEHRHAPAQSRRPATPKRIAAIDAIAATPRTARRRTSRARST